MSYETGRSPVVPILVAVLVGNLVTSVVRSATDNTDARIKGVQINNEQLDAQLSRGHEVDGLILNDGDRTFSFHSRTQGGQPETCTGKYDVQDDVARVTGPLACTQTVAVG